MEKPDYKIIKYREWAVVRYVVATENNSPFGVFDTLKEARADAKKYGLRVQKEVVDLTNR